MTRAVPFSLSVLAAVGLLSACASDDAPTQPNVDELPSTGGVTGTAGGGAPAIGMSGGSGGLSEAGGSNGAGGNPSSSGGGGAAPGACTFTCVEQCGAEQGSVQPGTCDGNLVCCQVADPGGGMPVYDYGAQLEDTGVGCEVPVLPEPATITKNPKLPNPFIRVDGTTISKKSDWHCRRKEIRAQAEKYVYGERPAAPELVSGTVSDSEITVHVEDQGKSIDFTAKITLPTSGEAPYPAIINLGSGVTLGRDLILNEGVAIITYNQYDLGSEYQDAMAGIRDLPKKGKFYDIYGGDHTAGLLMAWSWGASRLIDVLQKTEGSVIAWDRLGVTGCSRLGKGAFAIGLFDERVALTIPHETSTGGVPAYRIADAIPTEDTRGNFNGQLWFSDNFEPFVLNTTQLPLDTHAFIGMIAPRGLMILENPWVAQMGAQAGHMAALAGSKVYEALGVLDHLSYNSDIPNATHCQYSSAFTPLLVQNIQRFLKHDHEEPGRIESGKELAPADWIDWEAPALSDD